MPPIATSAEIERPAARTELRDDSDDRTVAFTAIRTERAAKPLPPGSAAVGRVVAGFRSCRFAMMT